MFLVLALTRDSSFPCNIDLSSEAIQHRTELMSDQERSDVLNPDSLIHDPDLLLSVHNGLGYDEQRATFKHRYVAYFQS
jgi:hypothetical protein